ncbi:MAG: alkaline phosphatase family protein [Candidatus Tumulicola sp.]
MSALATAATLLSSCGGAVVGAPVAHAGAPAGLLATGPLQALGWRSKIRHVVIIVQENRSFNNLFYGYPGAATATYGYDNLNHKIKIEPVDIATNWQIRHDAKAFFQACNGAGKTPGTKCRMNGFNLEWVGCGGASQPPCPIQHPQYSYVPHTETQPYFAMAKQYVLADHMFPSNLDTSSFVSHQYIIAGKAESAVDYPANSWGCPGGPTDKVYMISQLRKYPDGSEVPCWNPTTLGDELDTARLSWGYYAVAVAQGGIWSAYQAIDHIYNGPDWSNNVFFPPSKFFTDLKNGGLRAVTWITPTFANSDHPSNNSKTGPAWVASLVNAIGESPDWSSTAIFVFWDENGGLYDPVPPPYADYDGLGIRVPLLIISPYAKTGYVSHVQYEHGSMLKFIEDVFRLPRMAASDTRANSPEADSFNFYQAPRKFVPFRALYNQRYFMNQPADLRPPDTN